MKANLKGRGGIKGLFLLHGEKIAITLVGLLALWFVYSSLSLPKLEDRYQADKLQLEITQTNTAVEESRWPEPGSEVAAEVRIFKPITKSADMTVKPDGYASSGAGFMPVIPPSLKRTDPELLNAVDVRAMGGSGLFAFVDEQIRKQQELKLRAKEAELEKERQKQMERDQQQAESGREGRGGGRGREDQGEYGYAEFDPEHPDRRLVEGSVGAVGIPLQGGERIERAYWATVVAKVPIREQLKRYQDAFEEARDYDPTRDFPRYMGYLVQRSEVVRGKPLDWQPVAVYDPKRQSVQSKKPVKQFVNIDAVNKLRELAAMEYAGQPVEPVDPRWTDYILTLPLPPLVGRDFGADATHPDIPLAINAPPPEEVTAPPTEQPAVETKEEDSGEFSGGTRSQQMISQGPGAFAPGRMPGYPGGEFGRSGGYGSELMRGMPGSFRGEGMGEMRGYSGGGIAGPDTQRTTIPREVDFWLLRFFDFTVEPGKKYRYRVKLVLADPNYGFPSDNALDSAVLDRLATSKKRDFRIVEEWSEPSPAVGIPLAGSVYLAEAKLPSKGINDEPTVKLMVETFDVDATEGTAVQITKEKDFRRGHVVNLNEKMKYAGVSERGRWIDTYDSYKLQTGMTVLDVEGADKLTKDFSAPARALLMDPAGELIIRKELDDDPSVEYLRALFAEPKKGRGEGEGMMPGMFPGGRGFDPGSRGR